MHGHIVLKVVEQKQATSEYEIQERIKVAPPIVVQNEETEC